MKIKHVTVSLFILVSLTFSQTAFGEVIDRIVAIVNDDIITLVDLNKRCAPYFNNIESGAYSEDQKLKMKKEIRLKVLNLLVDNSLTEQEADRYQISVDEKQIDAAVKNFMQAKSLTKDQLEEALASEQMTMESYRETIRSQMLQARIINRAVKSKVVITESEIKAYYNAHAKDYEGQKKYHLRHILMADEEKLEEVKARLDSNQDFIGLAKAYSESSNASDGGDLGLFDITAFSSGIKQKIAELQKGQYTDIIATAQGYQIFYVEDIVVEGHKTVEQAYDEIHERLYREQVEKKFETWLESLKKQAHIEIKL